MKPDADEVVFSTTPRAVADGNVFVILPRSPNSAWLLSRSSGWLVAGSLLRCLRVGLVMRCGSIIAGGTAEMDVVCDTGVRRCSAASSVDASELSGVADHRSGGLWSPVEKDGNKGQRSSILPKILSILPKEPENRGAVQKNFERRRRKKRMIMTNKM